MEVGSTAGATRRPPRDIVVAWEWDGQVGSVSVRSVLANRRMARMGEGNLVGSDLF